jgi:hypothetical protein
MPTTAVAASEVSQPTIKMSEDDIKAVRRTVSAQEGLLRELKMRGLNDLQVSTRMKLYIWLCQMKLFTDEVAAAAAVTRFDKMKPSFQDAVAESKDSVALLQRGKRFIVESLISGDVAGLKPSALKDCFENVFECCGQAGVSTGDTYTCQKCKKVQKLSPVSVVVKSS